MAYKTMDVSENNNKTSLFIQFYIDEQMGNSTFGFENSPTKSMYIVCFLYRVLYTSTSLTFLSISFKVHI